MDIEKDPIYEGKSKSLFVIKTSKDNLLMRFKDDITAFNGERHDIIKDKGIFNNQICSRIFEYLDVNGIKSHYIMKASDRDMIVQKTKVFPIEVVVRNNITGGLVKRFGLKDREKEILKFPNIDDPRMYMSILELFYKSDELGDPLMNDDHAIALGYADSSQLATMKEKALRINYFLKQFFAKIGITLADFKLEFGINNKGELLLVDDICPDGCRLWDKYSDNVFDKDNYRYNYNSIDSAYREVFNRIISVYDKGITIEEYIKGTSE